MAKTIELNLEKDILEGWEHFYDSLNVGVLRIAKQLGHNLPNVDVVMENGIYRLVFGEDPKDLFWKVYGGHSRSIASLQEKCPLICNVLPAHRKNPKEHRDHNYYPSREIKYIPIQEMKPKRDTSYNALCRLKDNLQFLPVGLRKKFIKENSLVVLENGNIVDEHDYLNPPPF